MGLTCNPGKTAGGYFPPSAFTHSSMLISPAVNRMKSLKASALTSASALAAAVAAASASILFILATNSSSVSIAMWQFISSLYWIAFFLSLKPGNTS